MLGALLEASHHAGRFWAAADVNEVVCEGAIDEGGELARRRGDRLGLADAAGQTPMERALREASQN